MNFEEHLKSYLDNNEIKALLDSLNKEDLHAVLLNVEKMDDETFLKLFPEVTPHPIVSHAYIYKKSRYQLGKSIYHDLGCFYLQEPAAMTVAYLLHPNDDDLVLDLCAAPGGKSIQTSFLMRNKGLIISNDLSRSRCNAITENVERLGIGNIIITNNDFSKIYLNHLEQFDKIILDAPCSGSGMFRKSEAIKEDWSYNKVLKFQSIQKELIVYAYKMLKPGGILSYSTCSFSKEENEDVIAFLIANSNAQEIKINHSLYYTCHDNPLGIHLLPSMFPGEGHYICLLQKPGNLVKSNKKDNNKTNSKLVKFNLPFKYQYCFGDTVFGINNVINLKDFNVVRLGVKVGEIIKNSIKYDYHYAHYCHNFSQIYELSENELKVYFSGNVIYKNIPQGYTLLTYQGINVDIAKSDTKVIKNYLPKALRKLI